MNRASRLFQLVQLIRGRRLSTAAWLAQRLEVSMRSIYRDVATLQAQGVPIEGEAGVGYRMGRGFELPPLMFTADEARALVAAVRVARVWLDPALAHSADAALGRVLSALPVAQRVQAESLPVFAPDLGLSPEVQVRLQQLREAAVIRQKVSITYRDGDGGETQRTLRPLGCMYWGKVWTLAAWCETRRDFRSFRIERITALGVLAERFVDEPGQTLADLQRMVRAQRA
jgi:predicted DNA-binding transcriptional regulator YafY